MAADKKILKDLVDIGRKISRAGLIIGEGGNISARIGNIVYIKRGAALMGRGRATDYIPLNLKTGKPLRKKDRPSTEIYMHLACYRARKDIGAVIHTHPVFVTALGMAGVDMKLFTPLDSKHLTGFTYEMEVNIKSPIAKIAHITPGTPQLGKAVGRAVKKHNAVLLKSHGLVTVGKDLEKAFLCTLAVERAALTLMGTFHLRKALGNK